MVTPHTSALGALQKIQDTGDSLLVTDQNHLLATVSPVDISNFLAAKMEMEGGGGKPPEDHPQDLAA